MGPQVIIVAVIFGTIFGIAYLFFSTRNKERLALIEKGADAGIFVKGKQQTSLIWKILFLNCALIMIGVGLGIFIAAFLHFQFNVVEEVAYPGTIFLLAGSGLLVGFKITSRMD